jgi:hypothetical protein
MCSASAKNSQRSIRTPSVADATASAANPYDKPEDHCNPPETNFRFATMRPGHESQIIPTGITSYGRSLL